MKKNNYRVLVGILIGIIIMLLIFVVLFVTNTAIINIKGKNSIQYTKNNSSQKDRDSKRKVEPNNTNNKQTCEKKYTNMYSDKYIYKAKVINKEGAKVYNSNQKKFQKVIDTIKNGSEVSIVADTIDQDQFNKNIQKETYDKYNLYDNFENIKDYYYFAIDTCGEPKYIKYSDVAIIQSSITQPEKYETERKIYIHNDEYLFSGPGLSFENFNKEKIIPKGSILSINSYIRIGSAHWLFINTNELNGWILEERFNSVNYPYNNVKYGSAVFLEEEGGNITLENDTSLYKYPFSSKEEILKIRKGITVSYEYRTSEIGINYYYINYNGNSGWIMISE